MKRSLKLLAIPAIAAVVLAGTAVVWALWTASATGSAGTTAGSLGKPGKPFAIATPGSGTVPVSWAGVTSPSGVASDVRYYVLRNGGVAACDTTALTCNDTSVPDGPHTYTVKAAFHSWSNTSTASDSVTVVSDNLPPNVPAPSVGAAVQFGTSPIFVTNETLTLSSAVTDPGTGATGVASVKYYRCDGASGTCDSSNGILIGTSTTAAGNYPVTWNTPLPADGPYRIVAVGKDNANHEATSAATVISVDTTSPTVPTPSFG